MTISLLGDFNSEMHENTMTEFSDTYNLYNLVKEPTCFKNPLNPSLIDLILTNRPKSFQNSQAIETGLSDHHKLTVTVMRAFFPKQAPVIRLTEITNMTKIYSAVSISGNFIM